MARLLFLFLFSISCRQDGYELASPADRYVESPPTTNFSDQSDQDEGNVSTYPPDCWEVWGAGVTWATDFDIQTGKGTITNAYSYLGSYVQFTAVGHNLEVGQWVRVAGTTSYNAEYTVSHVIDTDNFAVLATYVADESGTFQANLAGPDSIKLKNTTPISDPVLMISESVAVVEGQTYRIEALVQATSVAVGNYVDIGVNWYDADDAYHSTSVIWQNNLSSAGVWYNIGDVVTVPVGARGAKLWFKKANTNFFVFLDDYNGYPMPVSFAAEQSSSTTFLDSTVTDVAFGNELFDYGAVFSTPTFTAPVSGVYSLSALITLYKSYPGFNGGGSHVRLYVIAAGVTHWHDYQALVTGDQYAFVHYNDHLLLNAGDTVKLQIYQDDGQTLTTSSNNVHTRFSVAKVE